MYTNYQANGAEIGENRLFKTKELSFFLIPRQLLLCRVALGKPFYQFSAVKMAHSPPGHHSVIGRPSSEGLSFAEYVVYRGEQVSHHSFEIIVYSFNAFSLCVRQSLTLIDLSSNSSRNSEHVERIGRALYSLTHA